MTIKEYNKDFLPKIDRATGFIHNLENAIHKTDDSDAVMKQLNCIGWTDDLKETIYTALEFYQKSVLKNEVEIN